MTPPTKLQIALDHHFAGRLREAERIYRDLLARDAGDVGATYLLGVVALQTGRRDEALPLLVRAAIIAPGQRVGVN